MARHQSGSTSRTRRSVLAGLGAAGATALAGCSQSTGGSDDEDELSGEITITGSSTVYPLATRMTNEFKDEHPDVTFSPSRTGSGAGFSNHFCEGNSMINNASRPITEGESEKCGENGVEPVELEIARDAVTIVVNNDADWFEDGCITIEELGRLWRPDDPAETWQDVNGEWPDREVTLWGAADTSGTYDYFTEEVVGEAGASRHDYNGTENDNQIISGIEEDRDALGYLGYAYYDENSESVTALSVETDGSCVEPSLENARTGDYPLARPLFTYPATAELATERVAEFCRFWVENSTSEEIVAEAVGYVPNDEETKEAMMDRLEDAIAGTTDE